MKHFRTRLSKKKRRKVYKRLLKLYKSDPWFNVMVDGDLLGRKYFETGGLCKALKELWRADGGKTEPDIRSYPELMEDRKFDEDAYFWERDEEGYMQRVMLLLEAIKNTK